LSRTIIEPPILVRDVTLAKKWDVSRAQIHVLRKRGLPFIRVGGAVRYDVEECTSWVREHGGQA
jgi:hypothetical protein